MNAPVTSPLTWEACAAAGMTLPLALLIPCLIVWCLWETRQ